MLFPCIHFTSTMKVLSFLLLLSIFLCCISLQMKLSRANILGNETDRLALLAFKSQITQDPLKLMSSWNDSNHFCEWEGVTCSHTHQRVAVLDLQSKGLVGSIPPQIGNLSFLTNLSLSHNSFHGEVPEQVDHLFRLKYLHLSNNSLVGKIPINISLCSNLAEMLADYNGFVGEIPAQLGSLSKLLNLNLNVNNLSGEIPPSLGNLTSLQLLYLVSNRLDGSIPSTIGQLKRLKDLALGDNNFSGIIPSSLYNLSSLDHISLAANKFSGHLPSDIGLTLPNLMYFYIGDNRFSGPVPISLFNASGLLEIQILRNHFTGNVPLNVGNLKDLQYLSLGENNLGSGKSGDLDFITPLTNCTSLQDLGIVDNRFGGRLPVSVGNFSSQLIGLRLGMNQITGNIPNEIENLQSLLILSAPVNFFTGSIPTGLRNLSKLQRINLSENRLSGLVPSFVRNMPQLVDLFLSDNYLEGSISSTLDNENLQKLDLSSNNFTGNIPKKIGLYTYLSLFNVTRNSLTGHIPSEVGNLENLRYLNVAENKMSGEIPSTLANCLSLQEVYLEGNLFQGSLPSSLEALVDLHSLDVSRNNLSGNIPKELEKMSVLTSLNLSYNNFDGEVPMEGTFQNASEFSVLGNKNVCGGIAPLRLPKCDIPKSGEKGSHLTLKVTLAVLIPLFIVGLSLAVYLRKKTKAMLPSEQSLGDLKRVSYSDLHKATGGFSQECLIGTGSYGSVYRGILDSDEPPIAVKVLNLMQQGASKTFMAECEALREVRHRNLLKILTVCSSVDFKGEDFKALVFEFMPNGSLESWLHPSLDGQHVHQYLDLQQRLKIAIDVALAVEYLHNHCEEPIAHCDLKSSNVLLSDDLTAHVGDFGLAKFLSKTMSTNMSNESETSSVALRGTIGYIPPEYGSGGEVSTQGDVYSYGILLLEIFTGKRPTDHMFKDGLNLHNFSKMALPESVMDIIDMRLVFEETPCRSAHTIDGIREMLSSIIRIGVACSMDLVTERMDMKDVLKEIHSIKESYFPGINS